MILSKAPFRVSFFGGGTDYPLYYMEHGGSVISTAIDKHLCIILRRSSPYSKYRYILKYSKIESVNDINQIEHPSIREVLRYFDVGFGVELHVIADLPARSGLGSSSTFTVTMIAAVLRLLGSSVSSEEIGRIAIEIEQNVLKEKVGSQDQIAAATGGFNKIDFLMGGNIRHSPIYLPQEIKVKLFSSMRLVYTNIQRSSSSVTGQQLENTKTGSLNSYLSELKKLTETVYEDLLQHDISHFGSRLNQAWELKKLFSDNITNNVIDEIYKRGMKAGASGGKLLGAGNGGFLLFCVADEYKDQFDREFNEATVLKIQPSNSGVQTRDIEP